MEQHDNCLVCQIIEKKIPSKVVYEDDRALAVLDVNGANPGHCFVIPKTHYPIIEQVPDEEVGEMFLIANKLSGAIFESLKVEGTNIFVANGIPAGQTVAHFMINVIPRIENDGVNLEWQPKQLDEEEMSTVELKLKDQTDKAGVSNVPVRRESPTVEKQVVEEYDFDDEDNPFNSQINRVP